ncbi:hypothetical protein BJY04DRAFT_63305 [Aspergillus karnatakaensis]|uniref:uncharacterized protein n=1 Tax=Aspergillus karnatakaensis TaxID=1810916 RepID=UPI003CCD7487
MDKEINLEASRIKELPREGQDAFYIAEFISEEEEAVLLQKINNPTPPWTHLAHRRLKTYPSPLTPSNTLLSSALPPFLTNPIVTRFEKLNLFATSPHKSPNHVLVNEYTPGQGIMPHEDGGAYCPLVATVSLGGAVVLDLYEKGNSNCSPARSSQEAEAEVEDNGTGVRLRESDSRRRPKYRILQERRSLLVTRDSLYRDYLHGIAEVERDEGVGPDSIVNWGLLREPERYSCGWNEREMRVSLTYRDVLRVAKVGGAMKFLSKR